MLTVNVGKASPTITVSADTETLISGTVASILITYSFMSDLPDQSKALTTTLCLALLLGVVKLKLPSSATFIT